MKRRVWSITIIFLMLLFVVLTYPTLAQDQTGSIRGTVYRDINLNGLCSDEGEVRLGDIPIEIVNDDTDEIIRQITAPDGTYVHTSAELGLWLVTVVPGTGWRVTSQQSIEVLLSEDQPDAAGVDFCIIEIESSNGGGVTLPESGAPIAPQLLIAAAAGLALMAFGAGMLLRGKKTQS
mgnify:CR=1 FL=1